MDKMRSFLLGGLERLALRSPSVQSYLIRRHELAFRNLLGAVPDGRFETIAIVGGGLFPRTVLALQRILPKSRLVVIDASAANIERAQRYLRVQNSEGGPVEFVQGRFAPQQSQSFDLVVIPLAFVGDRVGLYATDSGPARIVHDWLWHKRGQASAIISVFLLKRLNLVLPNEIPHADAPKRTLFSLLQSSSARRDQ